MRNQIGKSLTRKLMKWRGINTNKNSMKTLILGITWWNGGSVDVPELLVGGECWIEANDER